MTNKKLDVSILDFPLNTEPPDQASIDEAVSMVKASLKLSQLSLILLIATFIAVLFFILKFNLILINELQNDITGFVAVGLIVLMVTLMASISFIKVIMCNKFQAETRIKAAKPATNYMLELLNIKLRGERPDYLLLVGHQGRNLTEGEIYSLTNLLDVKAKDKLKSNLYESLFRPCEDLTKNK